MGRQLSIGDLIIARIVSFDRTRDPMLTVQDKDLGKIPYGEFIKISPTRVPRLIGKRGSMIQTIEQATQTRVIIGQNGIVVVTGRDTEGLSLAVKAIKMVEEESHTTNLTHRVKTLLNVPDPESETGGDEAEPQSNTVSKESTTINSNGSSNVSDANATTPEIKDSDTPSTSSSSVKDNTDTLTKLSDAPTATTTETEVEEQKPSDTSNPEDNKKENNAESDISDMTSNNSVISKNDQKEKKQD